MSILSPESKKENLVSLKASLIISEQRDKVESSIQVPEQTDEHYMNAIYPNDLVEVQPRA